MPSVVVLGGGYAGIAAVSRLARRLGREWEITLVDRREGHELQTRLPAVLSGRVPADKAVVPFPVLLHDRVAFVRGSVTGVDAERRQVQLGDRFLRPDHLVVALGGTPDFLGVAGARSNSFVFKSLADVEALRGAITSGRQQRTIRAVIVGAGYTGTEVAGELANWRGGGTEVVVVADTEHLLQDGAERLGIVAQELLRDAGVEFRLGVLVDEVTSDSVHLRGGDKIPADVVVWAARTTGAGANFGAPWRLSVDGRVVTDPYLQALGLPGVWLAGDAASIYDYRLDRPVSSSAQMAVEEGRAVADNIHALAIGAAPSEFRAVKLGEALSLGGATGVADVGGIVVTGRAAEAAKEAALLRYLVRVGGPRLAARYA